VFVVSSNTSSVNTLHKKIEAEADNPELRLVLYTSGTIDIQKGVE
jgi:hypothetical protein